MPLFLFSESEIADSLKSNEEDLAKAKNSQDTIMQAERYKARGLLYLEALLTQTKSSMDTIMQAEPYKQRGLLYLEAIKIDYADQKIRLASQFFSKAIALNADVQTTAFCLSKRASLNIAQRNVDAGIADFVAACRLVKNDAQIWFEYGQALVDLKCFEEALVPLKQALALSPQNRATHNLLEEIIRSDQVSDNCLDDIKALMKVGRTLNAGSQRGSDLHLWLQVVQAGNKDFMSYLAPQVNTQMHDGLGNTALHYAARAGHVHLIKPLVKYGIDPNAENRDGLTPIAIAFHAGHVAVMRALSAAGAKLLSVQMPLVAFQNFPLPKTNVFPTEETKGTKETRRLKRTALEREETTGLERTVSFRVFI